MSALPRASELSLPPDQRRMRLVLGDVLPSGRPSEARRSTPPSPEKARQYSHASCAGAEADPWQEKLDATDLILHRMTPDSRERPALSANCPPEKARRYVDAYRAAERTIPDPTPVRELTAAESWRVLLVYFAIGFNVTAAIVGLLIVTHRI